MRIAIAMIVWLAAALCSAPALAASPQAVDLAAWVSSNTDLPPAQVAIAGPEVVYSLEPLGPRLPTGEVLALVRTEAVSPDWRATHQFQSWDAHLLFDCPGGRVRVLRSASYAERDRRGIARADKRGDEWFSPTTDTPAATLLAAACDASFEWPLRAAGPVEARLETVEPMQRADLASVAPLQTASFTAAPGVLRAAAAAQSWIRRRVEAALAHSAPSAQAAVPADGPS